MKGGLLPLLAAILLAGGAFAQGGPAPEAVRCDSGKEADCLGRLKHLASRKGDMLRLKLENGTSKVFKSNSKACQDYDAERCVTYDLRTYLPAAGLYVVEAGAWESGGAEVVSAKTGRSVKLETMPEFSSGGRRFVSVNHTELGERSYDVAIWSITPDGPKQEFRYSTPKGDLYEYWEFAGWDGDDRIRLKVSVNPGDGQMKDYETDAVRSVQGWTLNRPHKKP